ncbi:hypothetical protein GCM10008967_37450 [Bacillus carboniphilus]|uniref:Lipoprotein n=1 Tax=Bacillus carboniphilus TaxID=86663 RepID=A0ABN0WPY9_9BACI
MKLKIVFGILFVSLIMSGCGQADTNDELSVKENDVENIRQLVSDYSLGTIQDESASITSQQLIVKKSDGDEYVYDLSDEDFFVSIAPYVDQTHPCTNHSLTGCQGELVKETFDVYIEDMEGNVIVDEALETQSNGFFDLWLPRNQTYRIKIEQDGKLAESEISTFESDGTCITTMQLM